MDARTLADLEQLQDLRERGVLSEAEFAAAKGRALAGASVPANAALSPAPGPRDAAPAPLPAARFDLISELVRQDHATVWKARDRETGALAAVKVFEDSAAAPDLVARAAAARRVESPYIVRVLGAGTQDDGAPFLAMEYVEGQSLRNYLRARGRLGWQEAVPIADQVLQSLEAAHEAGVVHGRLKPSDVLVSASAGIKVSGFAGAPTAEPSPYRPPEGGGSPAADLFAAGAIVYEMLAGHPAGPGSQHAADVPLESRAFLASALDPDPVRRPPTADSARLLLLTASPQMQAVAAPGAAQGLPWPVPPVPAPASGPQPPPWPAPYAPPPGYGAPPGGWPTPPAGYGYGHPAQGGAADDPRTPLRARGLVFKQYPIAAMVMLNLVTVGIFGHFWVAHWHGLMPKRRPDDPSTARAMWFLLLPLYNIYWMFESRLRLCTRLDEEYATAGLRVRAPRELVRWWTIAYVALTPLAFLPAETGPEWVASAIGMLFLGVLVLESIAVGVLQGQVNQLAEHDARLGARPR